MKKNYNPKIKIAGIFLCAGESKRFGKNKLLHQIKNKPLVYYSLKNALHSKLSKIYIVLGKDKEKVKEVIKNFFWENKKIIYIHNPEYKKGLLSSLKKGILVLGQKFNAFMVLLADMPFVTKEIINTLIQVFEKENKITIPVFKGKFQHPRIIPKRFFSEFINLKDNEKGIKLIEKNKKEVVQVKIGKEFNYLDIDNKNHLYSLSDAQNLSAYCQHFDT